MGSGRSDWDRSPEMSLGGQDADGPCGVSKLGRSRDNLGTFPGVGRLLDGRRMLHPPTRQAMPTYRAYTLTAAGKLTWGDWIEADDLESARRKAHELCD